MQAPTEAAVAEAATGSPLRVAGDFSPLADDDELRFREEVQDLSDPARDVVRFIEDKELLPRLDEALARTGVRPSGTIVELGAGSCWLAAALATRPEVTRAIGVEFSRKRLEGLAPAAIAALGAPPEKVERVVADFYRPGLPAGEADVVFTDAAYHHAADPEALARVAFDLLRPGGAFVLLREPTLALLRRSRDHGIEGEHGNFEHEYFSRGYLAQLRAAGFAASKYPVTATLHGVKRRLAWLNGIVFAEYTYLGVKPG